MPSTRLPLDELYIEVTICSAEGLYKSWFRSPNPYVILFVDGRRVEVTKSREKTATPSWHESFVVPVIPNSTLGIHVFDLYRYEKDDLGFLGGIDIDISHYTTIFSGGQGSPSPPLFRVYYIQNFVLYPLQPPTPSLFLCLVSIKKKLENLNKKGRVSGNLTFTLKAGTTLSPPSQSSHQTSNTQLDPETARRETTIPSIYPGPTNALLNDLPFGWEPRMNVLGIIYYQNQDTGNISLKKPTISDPSNNTINADNSQVQSIPVFSSPSMNSHTCVQSSPTSTLGSLPLDGDRMGSLESNSGFTTCSSEASTSTEPHPRHVSFSDGSPASLGNDITEQSAKVFAPLPSGWEMIQSAAGKTYFFDHNTSTKTWDDPRQPSSLAVTAPRYKRNFRQKFINFYSLPPLQPQTDYCRITVNRSDLFESSYRETQFLSAPDLKKKLFVKFEGEDGLDYSGVSREFFYLL
ncbi:E3 ubiquitin-protein ligase pub1, partial [Smittium mucronatum]